YPGHREYAADTEARERRVRPGTPHRPQRPGRPGHGPAVGAGGVDMIRARRLLPALVALVLLAGCASLPTDGQVHPGVEAGQDEGVGYVVADDPQAGAGPAQIVHGFQTAAVAGTSTTSTPRASSSPSRHAPSGTPVRRW